MEIETPEFRPQSLELIYVHPATGGYETIVVAPCLYGSPRWSRGHRYDVGPSQRTVNIYGYDVTVRGRQWVREASY